MKDPFEVDSDGKVTLYEKKTGKPKICWPVDAREILASSDLYAIEPERIVSDAKGDPVIAPKPNKEVVTREALEKMNKNELVGVAERNKIHVTPTLMTAPQIKDSIISTLGL